MRKQIRRVSLALGIAKRSQSPAPANETAETLAQFLSESKARYLGDLHEDPPKGGEWTVAMGNEAGDLDSIASSIAFAWIQSQVHQKPTVPLVQTHAEDLTLRPENILALSLAGITSPTTQLLTSTDLAPFSPFPSTAFALVDHNHLGPSFSPTPETANVIAVVDHHDDEKLYPSASPRIIAPCGSCASHIALLCPSEVPPELATLLLTAILIDTAGLKPGGKAVDTDVQAVAFLAPRSTYGASLPASLVENLTGASTDWAKTGAALHKTQTIKDLTDTLKTRKEDVSHLSARDLLRRDYKEYTFTLPWAGNSEIKAGLASVPVSLEVMGKDGKLEEALGSWVQEREIAVLGVLTSYKGGKDGKGKGKREMAWVVFDPTKKTSAGGAEAEAEAEAPLAEGAVDFKELKKRLWAGLEANADLKLKKRKKFSLDDDKLPSGAAGKVYKQGNAKANRKVTAPALKEIVESTEPVEKGKKKKFFA